MRGSLQAYDKFEEIKLIANISSCYEHRLSSLPHEKQESVHQLSSVLYVDKNVTLQQQSEGTLPLIEWTSGSPVVSQSLLRAR